MTKNIIVAAVITFLLLGCGTKPQEKILGSWVVDYTETFKTIKSSEIWIELGEMEREMFPDLLEEMIGSMKITIYEGEIITEMGSNSVSIPYLIESTSEDQLIANANIEGENVTLTFTILSKNLMMFSSDATDDMDFYVWKREMVRRV